MEPGRRFWHWPGWTRLGETGLLGCVVALWWLLIYGGANWVTDQHFLRLQVHLPFEPQLPFVPVAVLGYMSLYPLFWMAPFVLRTRRELHALLLSQAAIILAAGISFILLPVENAFPPLQDLGRWTEIVLFAKRIALAHNWLPSLHVGLGVVCVAVYASYAEVIGAAALWCWSAVIAVSTLLLHQHYLIDVIAGYGLALGGVHWGYRRWAAA